MAKDYLIEVLGCDDATSLIIEAEDSEFLAIKKLVEQVNEKSANLCQPTMSIHEATQADKRWVEDERSNPA